MEERERPTASRSSPFRSRAHPHPDLLPWREKEQFWTMEEVGSPQGRIMIFERASGTAEPGRREMEQSRKEDEEKALALAALSLVRAVIDALEQKAVFKDGEIQGIFERALASLEFRAQDGATGLARRIVEGIAITRGSQRPEDPSGSQDSH